MALFEKLNFGKIKNEEVGFVWCGAWCVPGNR